MNDAGKLAGSITAILGILALLIGPVRKARKARKDKREKAAAEEQAFRAELLGSITSMHGKLDEMTDDVAELQRDRLCQAHDHYMQLGWCPPAKKKELCDWHQKYTSRGHNHLIAHYEQDILELPEHPAEEED